MFRATLQSRTTCLIQHGDPPTVGQRWNVSIQTLSWPKSKTAFGQVIVFVSWLEKKNTALSVKNIIETFNPWPTYSEVILWLNSENRKTATKKEGSCCNPYAKFPLAQLPLLYMPCTVSRNYITSCWWRPSGFRRRVLRSGQSTRRQNPEHHLHYRHRHENLKSLKSCYFLCRN
jgi:hypothetical protein